MAKIYSTLSNSVIYNVRDENGNVLDRIFVGGKANIANQYMLKHKAVSTDVDEDQLEQLRKLPSFKRQVEAGFHKVTAVEVKEEVVVETMTAKDNSAPKDEKELVKEVDGEVTEIKAGKSNNR